MTSVINLSNLDGSNGFRIDGLDEDGNLGAGISSAGDLNGDGIDDLILGAEGADPNNNNNAGQSYVIFGRSDFNPSLDLLALNGSNGFTINGIDDGERSGLPVSSAGDINGDGIDDIIIAARNADSGSITNAGEVYVVFGNSSGFPQTLELSELSNTNGFTIAGGQNGDQIGISISEAGDINDDGVDDIIIGAAFADRNNATIAGEAYVLFGRNTGFPDNLNVSDLNGSNGFTFTNITLGEGSRLGNAVNDLGDINGDGIDDVIVTAAFSDVGMGVDTITNAGIAYVIFGRSSESEFEASLELSQLNGNNGFIINGLATQDTLGRSAAGAGDVNGDGLNDIVIGVIGGDPNGEIDAGQTYVIFGSNNGFSANFDLLSINGSNGFIINGIDAGDNAGASVAGAGDVNGDGIDDIIIGASKADPDDINITGEGYVVFGNSQFNTSLELSQLNGDNGFVINGVNPGDDLGRSVNSAGDVNGDNIDDIIIGASAADPNGIDGAGSSYVIFGSRGFPPDAVDDVVTVPFNIPTAINVLENDLDPENDPLTITAVTVPTNGTAEINDNGTPLDSSDNRVLYTPNDGFTGLDTFTYTIDDGTSQTDTATVTVTVNAPPNPFPLDQTVDTSPATPVTINVLENATDLDSAPQPLTITAVTQPTNGTATINDNNTPLDPSDDGVVYTPNQGFAAEDSFTYSISDGLDTAIANITVNVIPGIPTPVDDTAETQLNTPVTINVLNNDTDPEGDLLTLTAVTDPENGTVTLDNSNAVIYTPNPGFVGEDPFTYTVDDGNGGNNTANVTVTVIVIPTVSLIAEGTLTELEETAATFTINLSDPTPNPLTLNYNLAETTATNPEDFTLIAGSNIVDFTPNLLSLQPGVSAATLTVQPVDDVFFDPDETVQLNLLPGDGYTLDAVENTARFIITDNDIASLEITPTSGLITTEDGQTAIFNLVLTAQPTANVSLTLVNNDPSEGTLSESLVTFTPDNWDIPQTIIITGEPDVAVDGDVTYTISPQPTVSNDPNYNGLTSETITVTNLDLTQPTVIVNPTAGLITTETNGTATFNVVLGSQPAADVVLPLISNDVSEGTVFPETVTFTPTDWFTPQTVRVTGVNDPVDDGDIDYQIITQPTVSEDTNYNNLNPNDVTVTNEDNNLANIRLTPTTGLITSETGESANFEIFLTSEPTADVTINFQSDNPNEGLPSPTAVTFTPEDWSNPQMVTVTGVSDNIIDESITYNIITDPAISEDLSYNGLDAEDVNLINIDASEPFIVINPTVGLMTRENERSDVFEIVLNTQPSDIVTLNLSSSDTTEGILSQTVVNFTPDNWDIPQTLTVTGVDDNLVDGSIAYSLITDPAISNDINYDSLNPADILVTNRDDDLPIVNLSITPAIGTEADTTAITITATASAEVNGDQTVGLNLSGDEITGTDFTLSNSQITIANGTTTGSATLTILDDSLSEGDETAVIELLNPSSGIELDNSTATVTLVDNDSPATVAFSQTDYLITEDGVFIGEPIGFNRIGDLSQPSIVEIQFLDDTAIGNLDFDPTPLIINFAATEEAPVTNLTIIDDNDVEFEESLQLVLNSIENAILDTPNVATLTIIDNEQVDISIDKTNLLTTEAGVTDTYTFVLNREPLAPVTVSFETGDQLQPIPDIVLDSTNWNSPQTVTVTAVDDGISEGAQTAIIRHRLTSNDESYNNFNLANITVEIEDNQTADILLSVTEFSLSESNETEQYSLVLTSIPTSPVTVSFQTENFLNSIPAITFNQTNWNQPKFVNVTAIDDEINQGDRTTTITHLVNSEDENYNGLSIDSVNLTIIDDDINLPSAEVILNPINLTVTEAGISGRYEIRLTTEPTAPVTLDFITDNQIDLIPSITFDTSNFNQPQFVNVTAIDDLDAEGTHGSIILTNVRSDDTQFDNLDISPLAVTIEDNDFTIPTASIFISQTEGNTTVKEAEFTDTYNIVLSRQPVADVILNITPDSQTELGQGLNNPIQLLFTPENWNLPQTVTVTAIDDTEIEGNHTSTINHDLTSEDPDYHSETPILIDETLSETLTVLIEDNDSSGELNILQPLQASDVIEGYGIDRYKIVLTFPPLTEVSINIADNSQVLTDKKNITFTPENWNIPQIIALTAIDDPIQEGEHQTTLIHTILSEDNRFNNRTFPLDINISDNDDFGEMYTAVNQSIYSGTLQDDIVMGSGTDDVLYGNDGTDQLFGFVGADLLLGQGGDDAIISGSEEDVISGGKGNDYLLGNAGNDIIFGDEGRDRLFGGQGNDQLFGGLGNDRLWGDLGTDTLTGGEGEDAFVLSPGTGGLTPDLADIITDFNPSQDRIELTDFLTFDQLSLIPVNSDVVIQVSSSQEYLGMLQGVNLEDLNNSNFI